ncbi:phosphonate C-P lyase system protein PhnH [Oryzibacter oryziterrae]|uniref:phosphonate C-P lyase system protein PhnH n=1 Tax=Oryzibacter oryziterrae TaxID=2766474 RepID=UPI001F0C5575|nr:phosphonate C-P lyase system protein PhnH [Oryzibacter oryziterrae]
MDASTSLTGGFADPVFAAQSVFRAVMDCMARPGTIGTIGSEATAPGALGAAQAAIALTLCDADTPVWFADTLASPALSAWLAFHTGASVAPDPTTAKFAFLGLGGVPHPDFPIGTQDYPDRSATVVIEVSGFEAGEPFTLSGPGIAGTQPLSVAGLFPDFRTFWQANRAEFPRGIDLILTAGTRLVALPRSVRILD